MPEVDTSMYSNVGQGSNMLGALSTFANAQNALNQNKLFQAQMALGPILQQSVDPQTGQPDFNKAFIMASGNPATAPAASQLLNMGIERGLMQQETAAKALDMQIKRYGAIGQAASGLLERKGQNVTQQDVLGGMAQLYGGGVLDSPTMMKIMSTMPPDGPQLVNWLHQIALSSMSATDSMNQVYGSFAERNAPQQTTDAQGHQTTGPRGSAYQTLGPGFNAGQEGPAPQASGPGVVPQASGENPAPGVPGAPSPGGPPPGPQAQAQPGGPPAAASTNVPPQMAAYLEGSGKNIVDYEGELNAGVMKLPPLIERLNLMQKAMQEYQTGGGSKMYQALAKTLQATHMFSDQQLGAISQGKLDALFNKDQLAKIPPDAMAQGQLLNYFLAPQAVQLLKDVAQGTGRVMKSEVDTFLGNEDVTNDPAAIQRMLQFANDTSKNYFDQRQAFTDYKQALRSGAPETKGMDISDFPAWYSKRLAASGGLNFPGASNQGPLSGVQQQGGKGPVHWVIKNGKLVQE